MIPRALSCTTHTMARLLTTHALLLTCILTLHNSVLKGVDWFTIWLNSCKGSKSGHNIYYIYSTDNTTMYTANYNSQCSCHGNKHTCITVGNSEGPNVENSVAWVTLMGIVPLNTAFGEDPNWRNMLIRVIRRLGAWKVKW